MADTLGNINVPEYAASGTFPLVPDYPFGRAHRPQIVTHAIGNETANLKIEQRFLLGTGAKVFTFYRAAMKETDRVSLRNFWESRSGPYQPFTFNAPNESGSGTTAFTVRFADAPLVWRFISQKASTVQFDLIEEVTSTPSYTLNGTQTRFPSGGLPAALTSQVQQLIPLVKITVTEPGYPVIYLSDRRVTVGAQTWLPRLLSWDGIEQSLDGASDQAQFTFGNADRVMRDLSNDTDLWRASIEFSVFHVGTGIKLDLWKGEVTRWEAGAGPTFALSAADGLYELGMAYPTRRISRTCWKQFNDGVTCPAAGSGGSNLGTPCDKGFDTAAGCVFHTMQNYFGGIVAEPQAVRIKDNSTGVWGYSRNVITAASLVADSVYEQILPEIYTDSDMPVNAKIIAGRDESDFYAALGVVGRGPLGAYKANDFAVSPQVTPHLLDGQPPHGANSKPPRNDYGWRASLGPDPNTEPFSLGEGGGGPQTYTARRAAGTAFVEIRRSDEKGIQLSKTDEHSMQVTVSQGLSGWIWSGPGSRTSGVLVNPVWIAINALLRARGLENASAATQEGFFDVASAVAAAAICDTSVTKLVGSGSETQFKFRGVLQEERPLRDWIQDILAGALGYYTFSFGKLKIGIRVNSSVVEAWTEGNIIEGSLQISNIEPAFNHLTGVFSDEEFEYVSNSVTFYDEDHAKRVGGTTSPLYTKSQVNLLGCASKSQALRVLITRLREELGGYNLTQQRRARRIGFRTTILGLHVDPGMVCSLTHADMPTGAGEFRVRRWRLNSDWSVDIEGQTTTDEMYDVAIGPKPADVEAGPVPDEPEQAPADWSFAAATVGDGALRLRDFNCATNAGSVLRGHFSLFYVDEAVAHFTHLLNNMTNSSTEFQYSGDPLTPGTYILIRKEIMYVESVVPTSSYNGVATVVRGQFGTTAVAHAAVDQTVDGVSSLSTAQFDVDGSLDIEPGDNIVRVTPAGDSGVVAFYNAGDGETHAVLPVASLAAGNIISFRQRCYILKRRDEVVHFQPRFFKSPARVNFEHLVEMPFAGVAAITGRLENSIGLSSEELTINFGAGGFPYRLRTLGTTAYVFAHPDLADGTHPNVFEAVRIVQGQSLTNASAEYAGGASEPILTPGAPAGITLGDLTDGGSIVIGGSVVAGDRIWVTIGGGDERVYIEIPPFTITTETTTAQVASALRNWLNGTEEFTAWFDASGLTGSTIEITDLRGVGGTLACAVEGSITATPDGIDSQLGILIGRRYAVSFRDGTTPLESELSALSVSTGPTGAATEIVLRQIPVSGDLRVTQRRIWATPDGADAAPFYLVATISNNTGTEAVDTVTEATLAAQTAWPGSTQPANSGACRITVKRDGAPYCELRIQQNRAFSNVLHGLALPPLAEGQLLTADVVNAAGVVDLRVVLQ